jgi:anti-anti-sigma regulatory factor
MTIPLHPDHDGDCAAELRKALNDVPNEPVSIDLSAVPYLSSQALTELVRFHKRYTGKSRIVLQRPNALVFRTLNIVGFNKLFAIEPAAA